MGYLSWLAAFCFNLAFLQVLLYFLFESFQNVIFYFDLFCIIYLSMESEAVIITTLVDIKNNDLENLLKI